MNEINDLTRQSQKLIAESKRLRLLLQQTIEELEEVREQTRRHLTESYRRRTTANGPPRSSRRVRN